VTSRRGPLANARYRRLFGAQVIALVGTGLTTVALTLLAYDLAEKNAGAVVGIALALKMVVYVFGAPLITALATRLPRRRLLPVGLAAPTTSRPPTTSSPAASPGTSCSRSPRPPLPTHGASAAAS
jgi:MFS family permease